MVLSEHMAVEAMEEKLVVEYDEATVYGDFDQEVVLHEGSVRLMPNGWVALPTGRLLSPDAVHHIDP